MTMRRSRAKHLGIGIVVLVTVSLVLGVALTPIGSVAKASSTVSGNLARNNRSVNPLRAIALSPTIHHLDGTGTTTGAKVPWALRTIVGRDVGPGANRVKKQLGGSYSPKGATLTGTGFTVGIGQVSVGRGSSKQKIDSVLQHDSKGATYGSGGFTENFSSVSAGSLQPGP